jgi:hypothetical protein
MLSVGPLRRTPLRQPDGALLDVKSIGRDERQSPRPSSKVIKAIKCAKCGKEIPLGQEVKKGFLVKKSYHKECTA